MDESEYGAQNNWKYEKTCPLKIFLVHNLMHFGEKYFCNVIDRWVQKKN